MLTAPVSLGGEGNAGLVAGSDEGPVSLRTLTALALGLVPSIAGGENGPGFCKAKGTLIVTATNVAAIKAV